MKKKVTLVVPCYNEEEVIEVAHKRIFDVLVGLGTNFEIIYIDDGSRDSTIEKLKDIAASCREVGIISFSRNFGHQIAITAGMDAADGDAVVVIDADMQDPPELIPQMIAKWESGYEVVYAQRESRSGESLFKLTTAKVFYRLMQAMSDIPIPLDTGDFRLLDRKVVSTLKSMPERDRFVRGMVSWIGYNQTSLRYARDPRHAGYTKYPLMKMLKFAADGIFSFSLKPLRLATLLGFSASIISVLGLVFALIQRLYGSPVLGQTTLLMAILFLGGVQLICLGLIGEYVGRVYGETKQRPLYVVSWRKDPG